VAARTLSWRNQQKFILGRELHGSPTLLVVENPTRGLDVRASAFRARSLIRAADDGVAVVVHSADLDEIMVSPIACSCLCRDCPRGGNRRGRDWSSDVGAE
jgi:ABC-type uncharacterized transport system ATPase subunit